jgi:AbiV family abortive infection protein
MQITADLLRTYSVSALANAGELHAEATLLCSHRHFARAYFLAVASIEETGKAFLAFDGQGRCLSDANVASQLQRALEDHPRKIYAAFIPWLIASQNFRDSLLTAVGLMGDLRRGREPAMYTDILPDSGWYYLDRVEAGAPDWSEAVVTYREQYSDAGLVFRREKPCATGKIGNRVNREHG